MSNSIWGSDVIKSCEHSRMCAFQFRWETKWIKMLNFCRVYTLSNRHRDLVDNFLFSNAVTYSSHQTAWADFCSYQMKYHIIFGCVSTSITPVCAMCLRDRSFWQFITLLENFMSTCQSVSHPCRLCFIDTSFYSRYFTAESYVSKRVKAEANNS